MSDDIIIFLLTKKYINIKIDMIITAFTIIESKGILKKENNVEIIENRPIVMEKDSNGDFNRSILR